MLTYIRKNFMILIVFGLSLGLISTLAKGETISAPTRQTMVANLFYCPAISALKKDPESMTWSASGGWKSFDLSFVDKITRFSGAQWRGTNVGQIFCVYRGPSDTSFPILLAFNTLTLEPKGGKWSDNLGGYQNCETSLREECPFQMRIKEEQEDLYEQAEKLKKPPSHSSRSGF